MAFLFSGTITLGSSTLTATGLRDVAIAFVDDAGKPLRGKAVVVSDETNPRGLAVDGQGNLYLAATTFSSSVNLGDGQIVSGSNVAQWGLVAKFDENGVAQWGRRFSASGGLGHFRVAARGSTVVVTGFFSWAEGLVYATAQGTTTAPTFMGNAQKGFVASLDPADGLVSWVEQLGAVGDGRAFDVAISQAGEVVVTGEFEGGALQNDDPLVLGPKTGNDRNAFVTKLTAAGAHAWTRTFGAATSEPLTGDAVAIDAAGRVFVVGAFGGQVDFGKGPRSGSAFVLSLDGATGATTWDKTLPTGKPVGVTLAPGGSVALSLDVPPGAQPASVDGVALPTTPSSYVALLDPAGTLVWTHAPVPQGDKRVRAGALASGAADLVEHGLFTGTADFGGGPVTANGDAGAAVTSFLLGLRP